MPGGSRKIWIMRKNILITTLMLSALGAVSPIVPLVPFEQTQAQAATFIEVDRVPDFLGFRQGDRLRTSGLATGEMKFIGLNHSLIDLNQQITLNGFARKAIEQVAGRALSSKTNKVTFRFVVKSKRNGGFTYSLYDQGNKQLLMEGPVRLKIAKGATGSHQEMSFEAQMVSMHLSINKSGSSVNGQASFKVTGIPVPGSISFSKY